MIRGSSFDAHVFARALCEAAMRMPEATQAEVFVRVAHSWRCEVSAAAGLSTQHRLESGVALRVWDRSGREGFVHADSISSQDAGELLGHARWQLSESSLLEPGLIPRLPDGSDGDRIPATAEDARLLEHDIDEPLQEWIQWVREADASCSVLRDARLDVRDIWIERGAGHTWLVNSRGCDVGFPFGLGSAGLHAGAGLSTMRYARVLGDRDPSPPDLAASAAREAAPYAFDCAVPVPLETAPVLMAPRASAGWLRWIAAQFTRPPSGARQGVRRPDLLRRPGFHIVDESPDERSRYDGEGRAIGRRQYLRDGQLADEVVDSRDPSSLAGELGPMRRDSFRDRPYPGPLSLLIPSDEKEAAPLIESISKGLLVTALSPRVAPGADTFVAEVRGHWIEKGKPGHPILPTLIEVDGCGGLERVMARGRDSEPGPPGLPTLTPSLLIDFAKLVPF